MRQLTIFAEAARCGCFTAAATRLHMSTAAVSRSIASLEKELNARLFNRTTRHLNLTEDGQAFLAEVASCLDKLTEAKESLRKGSNCIAGTLKVLLPNSFCKNYMMPTLRAFLEQHPGLKLDMHVEDYGVDLLGGGFDVGVQYGEPAATGYISRSLGTMQVVLVASPGYLAKAGLPQSISDLEQHNCIKMRESNGSALLMWNLVRASDGVGKVRVIAHRPEGNCFVNSQLDTAIYAAIAGIGITPVDVGSVMRYLKDGSLKIVLPDYQLMHNGRMFLLYPHREYLPVRVRAFIDFLVEVAESTLTLKDFDPHRFAATAT